MDINYFTKSWIKIQQQHHSFHREEMHGEFASANRCSRTFVICINFSHLATRYKKHHCFLKNHTNYMQQSLLLSILMQAYSCAEDKNKLTILSFTTNECCIMHEWRTKYDEGKNAHKTSLNKYNSAKCCRQFMIIRSCACDKEFYS